MSINNCPIQIKVSLKMKNKLFGLLAVLTLLPLPTLASCSFFPGFYATDNVSISFKPVLVQRDTPIGTVLDSVYNESLLNRAEFIKCDRPLVTEWNSVARKVMYSNEELLESGVPGISIRVITPGGRYSKGRYEGPFPRLMTNQTGCLGTIAYAKLCGENFGPLKLELVKTAEVTGSGQIFSGVIVKAAATGVTDVYTYNLTASSVQTAACSVKNTAITVPLGNVYENHFSGVGSTLAEQAFTIPLDCNAGTKVNVTLDAIKDSSGEKGVIALSDVNNQIKATGVGVQLRYKDAPVTLGEPIKVGTAVTEGSYNVPLTARYYQTESKIGPGIANAVATFTMIYN